MRYLPTVLIAFSCLILGGCSTVSKLTDVALETVGLKKPEVPEVPQIPEFQLPPRKVALQLHAGSNLNAGVTNKPLSLVARVYKLKQTGTFYSAAYDTFLSAEKEKSVLGDDLIEVREVNLVPGQLYQVTEKVSRESNFVGIVTLFREPAAQRWRAAFAAVDAETSGISVGLHACSITLGKGAVPDQNGIAVTAASPARCQ